MQIAQFAQIARNNAVQLSEFVRKNMFECTGNGTNEHPKNRAPLLVIRGQTLSARILNFKRSALTDTLAAITHFLVVTSESTPERFCDMVMKGGITSGVVYPLAVTKLAERFVFKNIGGTSAGNATPTH